MPEEISRQIWKKKLNLCSSDAYISYFKYLKFRNFKSNFEEKVVKKFGQTKKFVFLNLPPAKIYTLEIDQNNNKEIPPVESVNVA
jgi:phospholipid N-methyltransferase